MRPTVRATPIMTLMLVLLVAACPVTEDIEPMDSAPGSLLPPINDLPQWSVADGPTEYRPDTLYEYLNGGADRYVTHGFQRLATARYQLGNDPSATVTLDVYDMGSELGAFGIYSAGRRPGVDTRPWGAEGYRDGSIACAYRGRVFVHGSAGDDRPELLAALEHLVAGTAEAADGAKAPPAVLDPLPATGKVAGSERYVPADLLGHSFLPGGVLATYERDGLRSQVWYSRFEGEAGARAAVIALEEALGSHGTVEQGGLDGGLEGFRFSGALLGSGSVARSNHVVAGIQGELDTTDREAVLLELISNLGLAAPGG